MIQILFLVALAIMTAVFATMIGNEANTAWQTAGDGHMAGLVFATTVSGVLFFTLIKDYNEEKLSGDIPLAMFACVACGAYNYGFISGSFNHGAWGWMNGWLILVLAGLYPIISEVYKAISASWHARQLHKQKNDVTPLRQYKD